MHLMPAGIIGIGVGAAALSLAAGVKLGQSEPQSFASFAYAALPTTLFGAGALAAFRANGALQSAGAAAMLGVSVGTVIGTAIGLHTAGTQAQPG